MTMPMVEEMNSPTLITFYVWGSGARASLPDRWNSLVAVKNAT